MKVTYINHSSFSVELDTCVLLFDYYSGNIPKFDKNKKLYVFSSHQHYDHFSPVIFDLKNHYDKIKFILSDDIKDYIGDDILLVKPNDTIIVDNLEIKTLESTDLGVAFIVNVDDKTIYHAGDLNWWHWEGENTPEQNKKAEIMYKNQIDKIKGNVFDLAFVPLDPRQGMQYYLGFDTFMQNTNTKRVFPMHCWENYSVIDSLLNSDYSLGYKDKVVKINHKDQEFIVK